MLCGVVHQVTYATHPNQTPATSGPNLRHTTTSATSPSVSPPLHSPTSNGPPDQLRTIHQQRVISTSLQQPSVSITAFSLRKSSTESQLATGPLKPPSHTTHPPPHLAQRKSATCRLKRVPSPPQKSRSATVASSPHSATTFATTATSRPKKSASPPRSATQAQHSTPIWVLATTASPLTATPPKALCKSTSTQNSSPSSNSVVPSLHSPKCKLLRARLPRRVLHKAWLLLLLPLPSRQ
jgi:hypothetical protein